MLLSLLVTQDATAAQQAAGQGIFTAQQAAAGKALYERRCANCHATNLTGGAVTGPIIGDTFLAKWGAKPTAAGSPTWSGLQVADLLELMIQTMPPPTNGPITPAEQLTILTYILQQNGFPTGGTALTANAVSLRDTTLQFRPTVGDVGRTQHILAWVDRQGREQIIPAPPGDYFLFRLSPDGKQIALEIQQDRKPDIWIMDATTGALRRVTTEGANRFPMWSADGKRVMYASDRHRTPVDGKPVRHGDGHDIYWQPADGSGTAERLTFGENPHSPQRWAPDGKTLSFYEIHPQNKRDIWMLSIDGDRKPRPFLATPNAEAGVGFSGDGKWLAYTTDETGRYEIFIRSFPDAGHKQQLTTEGGLELLWPLGSKEFFYRVGNKRFARDITVGDPVKLGAPKFMLEGDYVTSPGTRAGWDTVDGQRFLFLKVDPGSKPSARAGREE